MWRVRFLEVVTTHICRQAFQGSGPIFWKCLASTKKCRMLNTFSELNGYILISIWEEMADNLASRLCPLHSAVFLCLLHWEIYPVSCIFLSDTSGPDSICITSGQAKTSICKVRKQLGGVYFSLSLPDSGISIWLVFDWYESLNLL